MTNIKDLIEIALNDGYATPRHKVHKVEVVENALNGNVLKVYYFDNLFKKEDTCDFSI